jgi:hypothetical protein
MDLLPSARKWFEILLGGSCNHFTLTADKMPCVVDGIAGLSVCAYVYIFLCVYIYIYIK